MALKVHNNIAALRQINQLNNNQRQVGASIERVSSGLRINNAADDAAGTGLSGEMNSKNVSLRRAMKNVNDGVSLVHTAEGALNEINDILVRMRELALQSSNATYSNQDRTNLNAEFTQMRIDIGRIASNTHFNDIKLLDNACRFRSEYTMGRGIKFKLTCPRLVRHKGRCQFRHFRSIPSQKPRTAWPQ